MAKLRQFCSGVLAVISLASCAPSQGSASADSVRADSARTAARVDTGTTRVGAAAPSVDTAPPAGAIGGARKESGSIPSAGNASSAKGGTRVTGGPQRPPVTPRSSGCGGSFVTVTVKATALAPARAPASPEALRAVATELLAPVRGLVGSPSVSPAIRAFRVAVRDSASVARVVAALKSSPKVETAEREGCEVMIR